MLPVSQTCLSANHWNIKDIVLLLAKRSFSYREKYICYLMQNMSCQHEYVA